MPPATEPAATEPAATEPGRPRGLLLDIGGVVHATGIHLVGRLAEAEPALRPVLERIGGVASDRDELWQQMLRRQVTEREYWAQRAAELGAAVGESWDTRAMMHRMYELPRQDWLRTEMVDLMADTRAAGLRLGILKPDPRAFGRAAGELGLPPEQIVFLDDMPWNVEGARQVGLRAVRVPWDDPGQAIDTARELLGLPARRPGSVNDN